jgi:hypothetical protein
VLDNFIEGAIALGSGKSLGVNPADKPLMTPTGRIPASAWSDPTQLVGQLTQRGATLDSSHTDDNRCGSANLLGVVLLQKGTAGAAAFLTKAAQALPPAEQQQLLAIAERVKNHTSTYDDLSAAQGSLYAAGNTRQSLDEALTFLEPEEREAFKTAITKRDVDTVRELLALPTATIETYTDPRTGKAVPAIGVPKAARRGNGSGFDDAELGSQATLTGMKASSGSSTSTDVVADTLKSLKPGESAVVRVATTSTDHDAGHFVSVGKLADGRPFIYNPDPSKGDATLCVGNAKDPQALSFVAELSRYSTRTNTDPDGARPAVTVLK